MRLRITSLSYGITHGVVLPHDPNLVYTVDIESTYANKNDSHIALGDGRDHRTSHVS